MYRCIYLLSSAMALVVSLFLNSNAQTGGTLLIVVNAEAIITVDGDEIGKSEAGKPIKINLKPGEHFVLAKGRLGEASEIISITDGNQKVLKLELKNVSAANGSGSANNRASEAITIADLNFTIPGSIEVGAWMANNPEKEYPNNPNYYYAFEKGDEIIMDFSMTNAKGTNVLIVSTYPGNSIKYSNKAFTEIKDLHIRVEERSIFRFSLATNHAFGRNGKMTLRRIPASEQTLSFSTSVKWQKTYIPVTIQQAQQFYINSGRNALFLGGKSRITFPINIPKNVVEWYYVFSASRDSAKVKQTADGFQLASQLTKLIGSSGRALSFGVDQITQPPGSDFCDVYLLDRDNSILFEDKGSYRFISQGTRENLKSGVIRIDCCLKNGWYIGIKNPDSGYGIHVAIEVVAITFSEGWVMEQQ